MVELAVFGDHHEYSRIEVMKLRQRAGKRPIVMTEKDAVKLRSYQEVLGEAYTLTEEMKWDWGQTELDKHIRSVVGQALTA